MTRSAADHRRETPPAEAVPSHAQEIGALPKKILVLTPQFPYPPQQGTTIRNYNLIAHLAQHHLVHLLSFGDPDESQASPLSSLCQSMQVIRPPQRSQRRRLASLFLSRLPDMAQRLPSVQFRAALAATLEREELDVVQVEGIELAQYLFQAAANRGERAGGAERRHPLLVFDDHNAEYVLQQRAFETDARGGQPQRWLGAAYSFVQWQRLRGYERRACLAADRVVAVSGTDAEALRRLVPGLSPTVVPNGVDMAFYTSQLPARDDPFGWPLEQDLVFTGKMDFRPNVDAVLWFAQEVMPLLQQASPTLRFWIVGQNPHPRLATLANQPGVVLTGRVEDVRPYIAAAGVYAVPLRIGGGTRLKVLEAMAMGKAIVSTRLGCEGFDLVPGQELLIVDTPAEFAAAVLALLCDPDRRERMGRAARRFAGSRYDWSVIIPNLEQVYLTGQ
jgi:glycosyltransferase involved in cell wall biosynthesis